MGSPGELVRCVARVLKVSEATVVQYDRNLAEAGLRTKGGRGRSAARITSQDAANLLIVIAGAPITGATVKETLATWDKCSGLIADPRLDRSDRNELSRPDFKMLRSALPTMS